MMPKRAGDEIAGELLARGYYRMLGHLTEHQMSTLTEMVLDQCKWFPTVAECKEIMGAQSYANPFYISARAKELDRLGYPGGPNNISLVGNSGTKQIGHDGE